MLGRGRREAARSRSLRWFAGGAALVVGGATVLAMQPAHASSASPVDATFGLTGVSTSNCSTSTGGQNIYVTPGGELDFQSSVATLKLLSLPAITTANLAGLDGNLVIDPTATAPTKIKVTTTKAQKLSSLSSGDHAYTFSVTGIDVAGLVLPITLSSGNVAAGLSLTWQGTIHVTDNAATCGISLSLPAVGGTVQLPGMPPLTATILPQINVPTIAVPNLPGLPGLGGDKTTPPDTGTTTGAGTKSTSSFDPGGLTVPEEVVPKGDGDGPGTVDLSGFGAALPNLGSNAGAAIGAPNAFGTQAAGAPDPTSTPVAQVKANTVELASSPSPSAQMPVLLAIIAIIGLSLVTATYARLYLLRKI